MDSPAVEKPIALERYSEAVWFDGSQFGWCATKLSSDRSILLMSFCCTFGVG
jgi:hypothetical protein